MKKIFFIITITIVASVLPITSNAITLNEQINSYGIKLQDLDNSLGESEAITNSNISQSCSNNTILSLTTYYMCLKTNTKSPPVAKYAVVNKKDKNIWKVYQKMDNGIIVIFDTDMIMIMGKPDTSFDMMTENYLLKYIDSAYKYTTKFGTTKYLPRFQFVKNITIY